LDDDAEVDVFPVVFEDVGDQGQKGVFVGGRAQTRRVPVPGSVTTV
jgi:hypothetical protein